MAVAFAEDHHQTVQHKADRSGALDAAARRVSARAQAVLEIILRRSANPMLGRMVTEAIPLLDADLEQGRYFSTSERVMRIAAGIAGFVPALAATLLRDAPLRLDRHPMPAALAPEFETQALRILEACLDAGADAWSLDSDVIRKELAFCRLEFLPCRAQLIEKNSGIEARSLLHQDFATTARIAAMLATQNMRRKPYFESHTHAPMLSNFNEAGWTACFQHVAELLRFFPDRLGLIASAWFLDPVIQTLSPRLAYLRQIPHAGGAIILKGKPTEEDVLLATATSETRREAYRAGRYLPRTYTMIWPRAALLAWAERRAAGLGA